MNILILGGGGREHALVWAVKQNPKCDRLIVAPGNAGIADLAECATLDIENSAAVVGFAEANAIDFVIIGPEAPLVAGVSDELRAAGFLVFGPWFLGFGLWFLFLSPLSLVFGFWSWSLKPATSIFERPHQRCVWEARRFQRFGGQREGLGTSHFAPTRLEFLVFR